MAFMCQQVVEVIHTHGLECDPEIYHVLHMYLAQPESVVAREVGRLKSSDEGLTSKGLHFVYGSLVQSGVNSEQHFASMQRSRGHVDAIRLTAETSVELCDRIGTVNGAGEATGELARNLDDILRYAKALEQELAASQSEIFTDPLTGISNRRYLEAELSLRLDQPEQVHHLALLDIDRFKRVNDQYGHIVGDQVLRLVATELRRLIRIEDVLCRYGGEEFAIVFSDTAREECIAIIERVRAGVAKHKLVNRRKGDLIGSVTLSAGLAQLEPGDDFETAVDRADRLLYMAKQQGRDRLVSQS
jgi:diguanylate cyclase